MAPLATRIRAHAARDARLAAEHLRAAADLWRTVRPITETVPAGQYLTGRGYHLPPVEGDLRWHPTVSLFGQSGVALVGRITKMDNADQPIGAHLTWIDRVGAHWQRRTRNYLGTKAGGVVRLWPDEAVTTGLAIAKRVETALAVAISFRPVWAWLDAENVANFPVLEGIEALTIVTDHDETDAGKLAAARCAERWLQTGRDVRLISLTAPIATPSDLAHEAAA